AVAMRAAGARDLRGLRDAVGARPVRAPAAAAARPRGGAPARRGAGARRRGAGPPACGRGARD
ncbi:hypothetical protein, partial [Frankia sp. AgW1.1]|uniref:hypothetical protein n=1 Tax=Frankia sp. AgW1.1 TaxID=1836971 RepID=UPI001EE493FC